MSPGQYQELWLATSGTNTVTMMDPMPLPAAARLRIQLIHVAGATSKFKVGVQTTTDSIEWTLLGGPQIDWSAANHAAPGFDANPSTALVNATACRFRIEHLAGSCDTLIRIALHIQRVR